MSDEWHYIIQDQDEERPLVWARKGGSDPYGFTQEVLLDVDEIRVRVASNERTPVSSTAEVAAPIHIVADVLRRAGWTVTPPNADAANPDKTTPNPKVSTPVPGDPGTD